MGSRRRAATSGPLWVGPSVSLVGWLPGRLFGPTARLAALNARRNPGRTAATTAALTIGVGLMAAATVLVATVQRTATSRIDDAYPVDFVLAPAILGNGRVALILDVPGLMREVIRAQGAPADKSLPSAVAAQSLRPEPTQYH